MEQNWEIFPVYQRWALPEKEDHESRTLRCINIDLYTMRNFIFWKNLLLPGKDPENNGCLSASAAAISC